MRNYVEKSIEEKWEEASLSNNFIFCRVMSENLDLCKEFLEMLLNIQIESISLAQPEKTLKKVSEQAAEKEKLENARKMKEKNISDDIIAECTGLSLQKIQEL